MSEATEYQSQLADVEELLKGSPEDESLLNLKSDLLELISLVNSTERGDILIAEEKTFLSDSKEDAEVATNGDDEIISAREPGVGHLTSSPQNSNKPSLETVAALPSKQPLDELFDEKKSVKSKKKSIKKITKTFEIPPHLLPLGSDTDAERKRKRRTLKALKAQHRSSVKSYESDKKQQSWLDFSKKKKKKDSSIFATGEGLGAKVGVVTTGGKRAGLSETGGSSGSKQKRGRHKF